MRSRVLSLFIAVFGVLSLGHGAASGCGGKDNHDEFNCSSEPRAEEFVAGLEKAGTLGLLHVRLLEATPAPPDKGDNDWLVQVVDANGAPMDDATLTFEPYMPDHGHGTPIEATVTPEGGEGRYRVERINCWMPGLWEIRIQATTSTGTTDDVVYNFCIEG